MRFATILAFLLATPVLHAQDKTAFEAMDVFRLEFASDPQISPDGKRIVYVRNFMDIKKDRRRSNLWIINVDGSDHRALTNGDGNDRSPRWSHDSGRLLYLTGESELMCRWMDNGKQRDETRDVNVRPGQRLMVDFSQPAPAAGSAGTSSDRASSPAPAPCRRPPA